MTYYTIPDAACVLDVSAATLRYLLDVLGIEPDHGLISGEELPRLRDALREGV